MMMNKIKVLNNWGTVQQIDEKNEKMQEKSIYFFNKAQIFHSSQSKPLKKYCVLLVVNPYHKITLT